jgi:flagellar biosynthetic protein FliR
LFFEDLAANSQLFFIILVRIVAFFETAPLLSSSSIPQPAKISLAFLTAYVVFSWVDKKGYGIPDTGLEYALVLAGEVLIGVILGFFLNVVFSVFLAAGQFFSLQMGFGASEVFDPLAEMELPLMGQFLNIIAMFVFIISGGMPRLFLTGIYSSFQALTAYNLAAQTSSMLELIGSSLVLLFEQALLLAFPILGCLLLITISMGFMAKAAPQMNLLMLGFPISIIAAFSILFLAMPFLIEAFIRIIDSSFEDVYSFLVSSGGRLVK